MAYLDNIGNSYFLILCGLTSNTTPLTINNAPLDKLNHFVDTFETNHFFTIRINILAVNIIFIGHIRSGNWKFYNIYLFMSKSNHKLFIYQIKHMINGQSGGVPRNQAGPLQTKGPYAKFEK